MNKVIFVGVLLAAFVLVTSLPSEGTTENKDLKSAEVGKEPDDDFPTFDDENDASEKPFMVRLLGGLGRILNSVMQLPSLMARMFNYFVTTQPFSKLREEARNLNISYPKTGLLF